MKINLNEFSKLSQTQQLEIIDALELLFGKYTGLLYPDRIGYKTIPMVDEDIKENADNSDNMIKLIEDMNTIVTQNEKKRLQKYINQYSK